jgi:hypothetical protein
MYCSSLQRAAPMLAYVLPVALVLTKVDQGTAHLYCPLHWCRAPVLWQQARVYVEHTMLGDVQERSRQHVAVCCCHCQVWLHGGYRLQESRLQGSRMGQLMSGGVQNATSVAVAAGHLTRKPLWCNCVALALCGSKQGAVSCRAGAPAATAYGPHNLVKLRSTVTCLASL